MISRGSRTGNASRRGPGAGEARRSSGWIFAALLTLLLAIGSATAFGANEEQSSPDPLAQPTKESFIEAQLTDPQAAEELPHSELERPEALELLTGVFQPELQSPAGVYDELEPQRFISDYAAVIPAGRQPEPSGILIEGKGSEESPPYEGPTLLQSTLALRTEGPDGQKEAVDLSLQHADGELQPSSPLVEVGIPGALGDGIALPESGVKVELLGAPAERAPSVVEGSVAAYPEVAVDTALSVAPTPTGMETLTMMQSAGSPDQETFRLQLPAGATLKKSDLGGAEALKASGDPLLNILPPTAIDATGAEVPVRLEVIGDTIELSVVAGEEATFPILVDPIYQTYTWYTEGGNLGAGDWTKASNTSGIVAFEPGSLSHTLGLIAANGAQLASGAEGNWSYYVPRWASDKTNLNHPPKTYISEMVLSALSFEAGTEKSVNPILEAGLEDEITHAWTSSYSHWGIQGDLTNMSATYSFPNTDHEVKRAIGLELVSMESHLMGGNRATRLGGATITLADEGNPRVSSPSAPNAWMNKVASGSITVTTTDEGLGVKSTSFEIPGQGTKTVTNSCTGLAASPCPEQSTPSITAAQYNPAEMPQGIDNVTISAEDVVGNKVLTGSVARAQIKVDHTAPTLGLWGTLPNQFTFGTKLPTYNLIAEAKDGTEAAPQSGISEVKVELDNQLVKSVAPKCTTENCPGLAEWTLESSKYARGAHTLKVTATDAVGLVTTKEIPVTLNPEPPNLAVGGTITEQETLGTRRPTYRLRYTAADGAGPASPPLPGLVAAYSFDEGVGETAHDATGNHNAKIEGAKWTSGKYGNALEFDASKKAEVTVPDSEDLRLNSFTLEAWVSPQESRKLAPVIAKTETGGYGYALFAGGDGVAGHPEGYVTNQQWVQAYVYDNEGLPLGKWSHLAITSDGQHLRLYVNGALVDERASAEVQAGKGPLQIGGDEPFAEGGFFDGKIDEVRVYNRALSAAELKIDKNNAIQSPPSGGPIAAYSFNEFNGSVAHDSSGHGHDATITGAKWVSAKFSTGLQFKASEKNVLTIPDSEDLRLEKFTLEAWVDPTESKAGAPIFAKVSPEDYGYALYAGGEVAGHPEGYVTNHKSVNAYAYGPSALVLNTWTHLALSDDGQNLRLYVNGELLATHSAAEVQAGTGNLQIGGTESFGAPEYFTGKLDELRVYPRALSAAEIVKDKEAPVGFGPTETNIPTGVSSTEVKFDDEVIDESKAKCSSENCFITREVTLDASKKAAGNHTVVVKAADSLGNVSTKTIPIEIQKDTTKPTIQLSGELVTAPEGWVEQEHPYSFKTTAVDAGYGVTSLALKIDEETVASTSGACPEGACEEILSKQVNASSLSGGAHTATVVATDGAGNTKTESWTVNVDPAGNVSNLEAIETLEAVEDTMGAKTVAPTDEWLEPEQIAEGAEPSLEREGSLIESSGVSDTTTISNDPSGGIKIEGPETELTIAPVSEGSGASTAIASEVAAVQANSGSGIDTVVRPEYDGALVFQTIRDSSSPESFSWEVHLQAGQVLVSASEMVAEVHYNNGTTAFLVEAALAHDALGHAVPTTLSVEGNVLTLHVLHKEQAVTYPVLEGEAYETSYTSATVQNPPPSEAEGEYGEEAVSTESPPAPNANPKDQPLWYLHTGAHSSKLVQPAPRLNLQEHEVEHNWKAFDCGGESDDPCKFWEVELAAKFLKKFLIRGGSYTISAVFNPPGECHMHLKTGFLGFRYVLSGDVVNTNWFGLLQVGPGFHEHLSAFCHFWLESWPAKIGEFDISGVRDCKALVAWIWPNGEVKPLRREWKGPLARPSCPQT